MGQFLEVDIQEKWQSSVKTKGLGQFGITGEAIREQLKPVKLEIEFAKYQERIKIRGILEEAFLGNRYEEYSDRT